MKRASRRMSPGALRVRTPRVFDLARVVGLAGVLFLTACGDDSPSSSSTSTPSGPVEQRADLSSALERFRTAYNERDAAMYTQLFRPDFHFVFDPVDVAEDPDIPPYWGVHDEIQASGNMFDDEYVQSIALSWDSVMDVPADPGDEGNWAFPPGTRKVTLSGVHLEVVIQDPIGGDPLFFIVDGDQAIFFLTHDAVDLVGSWRGWKILEWRDVRIDDASGRPIIEPSWGQVKNLFR